MLCQMDLIPRKWGGTEGHLGQGGAPLVSSGPGHPASVTSAPDLPVGDGQECEAIHGPPGQAVSQVTTKPDPQQGWETQQLPAGRRPVLVHSLQDLVVQGQDVLQLSLREPPPAGRKGGKHACVSCTWRTEMLGGGWPAAQCPPIPITQDLS